MEQTHISIIDSSDHIHGDSSSDTTKTRAVCFDPHTGVPLFHPDILPEGVSCDSADIRLLALAKAYQAFERYYPYSYSRGKVRKALKHAIREAIKNPSEEDYQLLLLRLLHAYADNHCLAESEVLDRFWGNYIKPYKTLAMGRNTLITHVYTPPGDPRSSLVRPGDRLVEINGESLRRRIRRITPLISYSNNDARDVMRNYYLYYVGKEDTLVVTVKRASDGKKVRVGYGLRDRQAFRQQRDSVWEATPVVREITNDISCIHLGRLDSAQVDSVMRVCMEKKAIIFDLRHYPNNTWEQICHYLLPGPKPFYKALEPLPGHPGQWHLTQRTLAGPDTGNTNYFKGKIVVLINAETISHGEFTCMALQAAEDVTLVGSRTAGSDGNVATLPLPCGITAYFTGIGIFYPDGRATQRVGITPDIRVKRTRTGIREGRDEVLERAVKILEGS